MSPNPHPECCICRLIHAAQDQPIDVATGLLKQGEKYRCLCHSGKRHKVMMQHPHTDIKAGCKGFQLTSTPREEVA